MDLWMESKHFNQFIFLAPIFKRQIDRYARCTVYGVCQCMVSLWAWAWAWRLIIHNTADCRSASPLLSSDGEILSRSPDTLTPTPPQHSVTAEE